MNDLLAELHDLRTRLDAAEQQLARRNRPRRRPGGAHLGAALLLALVLALAPLSLLAAGSFTDLVAGSPHNADIAAIYDAGITTGCVPGIAYCPTANVTRQEMASFLARTAGLGDNSPVVNALTAVTAINANSAQAADHAVTADRATRAGEADYAADAGHAATADQATQAGNAGTVGGYAPSALVRVARAGTDLTGTATKIAGIYPSFENALTLTIDAPGAGFVLLNASVGVQSYGGCTASNCGVFARLRHGSSGAISPYLVIDANPDNPNNAVALTYVFPVTAGSQTFQVQLLRYKATADLYYFSPQATALFVPFGSGGAGALGADAPTNHESGNGHGGQP